MSSWYELQVRTPTDSSAGCWIQINSQQKFRHPLDTIPPDRALSGSVPFSMRLRTKANWGDLLKLELRPRDSSCSESLGFYSVVVEVTLDGKGWFGVDRAVVAADPGLLVSPYNAERNRRFGCLWPGLQPCTEKSQ